MKKRVVLLGATGSIGKSALDIITRHFEYFDLVGFSYHTNAPLYNAIKKDFPNALSLCTFHLKNINTAISSFKEFFEKTEPDIILNGISTSQGLLPSFVGLNMGINLALANKESIVLAYDILKKIAKKHKAKIIPVDSEHWAIFSLLNMLKKEKINKIIITASGGAFRDIPSNKLSKVTLEECFNHPTWNMGKKITIDSATLANKALEVIEATKLFSLEPSNIIVTIHKESIVHSMVETKGGTIYAQCSPPDMRAPIFGALMFPNNVPQYLKPLDFNAPFSFHFSPPRYKDFPLLNLGFQVAEKGVAYPIAFNASNEVAVSHFMKKKIGFLEISKVVESTLQYDWSMKAKSIEAVFECDSIARKLSNEVIRSF